MLTQLLHPECQKINNKIPHNFSFLKNELVEFYMAIEKYIPKMCWNICKIFLIKRSYNKKNYYELPWLAFKTSIFLYKYVMFNMIKLTFLKNLHYKIFGRMLQWAWRDCFSVSGLRVIYPLYSKIALTKQLKDLFPLYAYRYSSLCVYISQCRYIGKNVILFLRSSKQIFPSISFHFLKRCRLSTYDCSVWR